MACPASELSRPWLNVFKNGFALTLRTGFSIVRHAF